MDSITNTARQFFGACERGKGWVICRQWCAPDATFAAQAEPLADVRTLEQYTDWMKGLLQFMPDGRYELRCFAVDGERHAVSAYAVFKGAHTGEGGPCPPTGRQVASDYVYVMFFERERIRHMQKIWHAGLARIRGCKAVSDKEFAMNNMMMAIVFATMASLPRWSRGLLGRLDPLYGQRPPDNQDVLFPGQMAIQGERGMLLLSSDWLLRLRHNPFYAYLDAWALEWIDRARGRAESSATSVSPAPEGGAGHH